LIVKPAGALFVMKIDYRSRAKRSANHSDLSAVLAGRFLAIGAFGSSFGLAKMAFGGYDGF
jgi:hypothetical protein